MGMFDSIVDDVLKKALKKHQSDEVDARVEQQEKLYHYYVGNEDSIKEYLAEALSRSFDEDDISEMQLNWINITRKIVDKNAVVYRSAPKRRVFIGDEENEKLTKYYNDILDEKITISDRKMLRYAKLLDTNLGHVYFDEGKFRLRVRPSHLYTVIRKDEENDKFYGVMYDKQFDDKVHTVVWTDTEHYKIDQFGNESVIGDNNERINPYEELPFVTLRVDFHEGFWGEGQTDLVNVNEQINLLLSILVSDNIIMGSGGTLLGVNLDLKKKGKKEDGVAKVRRGRKHPITVENAMSEGKVPPRLEEISSNPLIKDVRDTVDWFIKMIAMTKNINPNSFLAEVKSSSGYSKVMDALEEIEIRNDDLVPCREYEREKFNKIRIMNNYHCGTEDKQKYGLELIPEDAEILIDFEEVEIPKTTDELWTEREYKLKHNMETPVDWLMQDNPDIKDREQAEGILLETIKFKKQHLNSADKPQGIFDRLRENKGEEA